MLSLAIFISGSGSDMQSIIDAVESGYINARIKAVIASREGIYGIERAIKHNIPYYVFNKKDYASANDMCIAIKDKLLELDIDLIALAGYLNILTVELVDEFRGRIVNIHPSLIPKHCGMGYYGIKVHQSVISSGDSVSGATIHYVDENADTGEIIMQESVPVEADDTAESLAARVLKLEHTLYPKAIKMLTEKLEKKNI